LTTVRSVRRFALEQFHHQIVSAILATDVEDGADVRMGECGNRVRLSLEAGTPFWI
jgi:hypothetical protein